jgi:hypothetical protein
VPAEDRPELDRPDRTDLATLLLARLEEEERRDRVDPVRSGDPDRLVDVHLRELDAARHPFAHLADHGLGDAARRAPVGVEIDDDREVRSDDLGVERRIRDVDRLRPWRRGKLPPGAFELAALFKVAPRTEREFPWTYRL